MLRFAGLLVLLLAAPALAAPMTTWDAKKNGEPKVYQAQGLSLTFSTAKNTDDGAIPVLAIRARGMAPFILKGDPALETATADFAVGRFDPKSPGPQVLFSSYTGGAHCCNHVTLIERAGAAWHAVDLGQWDGAGNVAMPTDLDGDGAADFVFVDNDFLYAFDSYAGSWAPPKILNVIGGKMIDVSADPRLHAVFEADMARAKPDCLKKQNGVCSAYVADGARIGQFDAGWKFMLAHYDRNANWDYPTRCIGTRADDGSCKGQELKPKDYPQSLRWFLEDHHYIPKSAGN